MITQFQGASSQAFCARQPKGLSDRELRRVVEDISIAASVADESKQAKFTNGIINRIRRGRLDCDTVAAQLRETEKTAKLENGLFPFFVPKLRKSVEEAKSLPPLPPFTVKGFLKSLASKIS